MRVAFFDTHRFEREIIERQNTRYKYELTFFDCRLGLASADLARGFDVVCVFVNDHLDRLTLGRLKANGIRLIALRCAGYNNVDLPEAARLGLPVVRVPEYSPYAVAEHAIALMLTLNRKIHRAYLRVREMNFSLDGLVGFDMAGKTVGVIGTGRIGKVLIRILGGFGCHVLAYDIQPDRAIQESSLATYCDLQTLYRESDIISLHLPLTNRTKHIIGSQAFAQMKPEVLLINTGRGALIDTKALINALKCHHISGAGLDVYEEEDAFFFRDLSEEGISDDLLARLLTFPNVVITAHQAFLTKEALMNIAATTLANVSEFEAKKPLTNGIIASRTDDGVESSNVQH